MTSLFSSSQEPGAPELPENNPIEQPMSDLGHDLSREATNMLELLARQADAVTLLNISSKAAQAVIKQF